MIESFNLNGAWQGRGTSPDGKETKQFSGNVPGMVHTDLYQNKLIPEPFWRDNAKQCQWPEHWYWEYEKCFTYKKQAGNSRLFLEFDGVDTYAEIILNGKTLGNVNNMHIKHRFDVTDILVNGENTILVKFTPYHEFVKDKDLSKYGAAFNYVDRVFVRRMQCTFWWDWVERFITVGMWRDVRILCVGAGEIESLYAYTHSVTDNIATLNLEVEIKNYGADTHWVNIEIFSPNGKIVWSRKMRTYMDTIHLQADIRNAQLWWPNGYGEQPLYELKVSLSNNSGEELDEKSTTFGIRTVKVVQLVDEPDSKEHKKSLETRKWLKEHKENFETNTDELGYGFTLYINDTPVFCRGGNWVPADPFPSSVTPEKYHNLIKIAKEGNMNMLRVWGGGIYEGQEFWDACNKYGIMVNQDFMMACGRYPGDDSEFVENIAVEAEYAVKALRNNPALVWWSGDNENTMWDDFDDVKGRDIWCGALLPALLKYEKSRPYFFTSPYGGRGNMSMTMGDTHFSNILVDFMNNDFSDYLDKANFVGRFMSESFTYGSPHIKSLLRFMEYEDLSGDEMFEYHNKSNPYWPEGCPTTFGQCQQAANLLLGEYKSVEERIKKIEYVHYILNRTALEGARRNRFYCSGILFWMFNDCWPAIGWSMVDYYQIPKAGFYGFQQAGKPVIVSVYENDIYICNDLLRDIHGNLSVAVYDFDGNILFKDEQKFSAEKNSVFVLNKKDLPKLNRNSILVCEISGDGFETSRGYRYAELPLHMPLENASVTYEIKGDTVTLTTDKYARAVSLYGEGVFSDNYFDMLPGETKVVTFRKFGDGEITISWLNE